LAINYLSVVGGLLSGSPTPLAASLSHFFKLITEHVHLTSRVAREAGGAIGVNKIATKRNACHAEAFAEAGEASIASRLRR
jgi:hypothetical protein